MAQFTSDFNSPSTADKVNADIKQGQQLGANATPTIVINGRKLVGALPYDTFKTAIDQALGSAR